MYKDKFTGVGVALITPFKNDGTIDYDALSNLIDFQIAGGVDFIVVLGTTAENPSLTQLEKDELTAFVVKKVAGRLPLMLGVGGNSTHEVVTRLNAGIPDGFSAILSVAPFYNKPSQEGLFQHFTAIADASPVPVMLYNVPSRTGVNMTYTTTIRLSKHPNIIGIKEASGILGQADKIIASVDDDFIVLSGDDILTLPMMSVGGKGVISVIANAFPKIYSDMVQSAKNNDFDSARKLHRAVAPVLPYLFCEGNPAGIKCLLSLQNKCQNILRLPLVPVSEETKDAIKNSILKI